MEKTEESGSYTIFYNESHSATHFYSEMTAAIYLQLKFFISCKLMVLFKYVANYLLGYFQ